MGRDRSARVAKFEALYNAHFADIARYASRRCDRVSAIDVVAEAFTIAWRRFDEIEDPANARPWLYGIARRVIANQLRGDQRRHALTQRISQEWLPVAHPPSISLEPLRLALGQLTAADREILILAGVEELTPAQIAVVLEISPAASRTRLSRARSRLQQQLESNAAASSLNGTESS